MSDLFRTTYVLLWLVVGLLCILVVLLYRQLGLILMPPRARVDLHGLDIGSKAPALKAQSADGPVELAWPSPAVAAAEGAFLVFGLPGCPICAHLLEKEDLGTLVADWPEVQFAWIDATEARSDGAPVGWSSLFSPDSSAHEKFDVSSAPFAYAIRSDGTIASKGIINNRADVRRLLQTGLRPEEDLLGASAAAVDSTASSGGAS